MPSPDNYARVTFEDDAGWHQDLMPIIFGGECKPREK